MTVDEDQTHNHITDPQDHDSAQGSLAPGDEHVGETDVASGIRGYLVGLVLAVGLTAVSFYIARSTLVWTPSIPIALSVLALAFGLLIVMLVVFGSLWIMSHMNTMMPSMDQIMKMQR